MNNLLPSIKKSITNRADDKNASWRPADANPVTGKIPYFLESEITKESTIKVSYGQNVLPMKEPNQRHIEQTVFGTSEDSPLKAALREKADKPRLLYVPPPSLTKRTIIKDTSSGTCLMLKLINALPLCMDLFVQKKLTISSTSVFPMRQCVRSVNLVIITHSHFRFRW